MLDKAASVTVVGCGGIGSWLVPPLCRFLAAEEYRKPIHLWDGDRVEPKNLARQGFVGSEVGEHKAEVLAGLVIGAHPELTVRAHGAFIDAQNVGQAVPEGGLVFTCVDNHPVRALIDARAEELFDVCVITAGNEYTDGNAHIYQRVAGIGVTKSLRERHPEVATSVVGDRGAGCEALVDAGQPQLLFTNFWAAACALGLFWSVHQPRIDRKTDKVIAYQELYFDLARAAIHPVAV